MIYKVWFEHSDGPYFVEDEADSEEELIEFWQPTPFFICVEPEDSDFVPTG